MSGSFRVHALCVPVFFDGRVRFPASPASGRIQLWWLAIAARYTSMVSAAILAQENSSRHR